jgi:ATP-dependent Clp protease adapter protein ClpS
MMKFSLNKYNEMIASVTNQMAPTSNVDVDTDSMTRLLNDLGISSANDKEYKLILWNDHVNDMISVVVALYEVCKLDDQECLKVMMEAHEKGKAVVKTGSLDELGVMKTGLNDRNLEATIEEN